jgi:hypothetical protein
MNAKPVIYINPELDQLRQLVAGARAQLAELETDYTKEKSRVDVVQAVLFRLLREYYQRRDRLRLTIDYRRKFLDALLHSNAEEAKQAEKNYEQAKTQADKDYEELSAAADKKQQLTAEQEAELTRLWKKLVKLYHPDRFANEPDKLETYHKLTAAINRAKDTGDIELLHEIAEDPQGFILRQGWASLDFSDVEELTQLRRLHEALQKEIAAVTESLKQLRESPDYELCQLSEQKSGVLDELAAERTKQLEVEIAELEKQAEQLASEIKKLTNQTPNKRTEIVASPNPAEASTTKGNAAQNSMHMKPANLCSILGHAFFILILAGLVTAGVVLNNALFALLAIGVGVIYYWTISKITTGAILLVCAWKHANFGSIIAKLIAAVMLFAAPSRQAYDYYTLLRWITCGVCAYTAFQAMQNKKGGWLFIFITAAIVLNPIAPLHLKRDTWAIVDAAAAVLILLSIAVMDIRRPRQ